jgi:GT2 family glycosyltransferase
VYEANPGLSRARNAGVAAARGDIVAFLDDDAEAEPEWLERILDAFSQATVRVGCLQGRIMPLWEAPRPDWLTDGLLAYLSVCNWSSTAQVLDTRHFVVGANIALPRRLLVSIGGFSPDLGRRGNSLLSGEEEDIRRRIESRGFVTYYYPAACVTHAVPSTRLTRRWFVRRAFWQGVTTAILDPPGFFKALRTVTALLRDAARLLWLGVAGSADRVQVLLTLLRQSRKCGLLMAALVCPSRRRGLPL